MADRSRPSLVVPYCHPTAIIGLVPQHRDWQEGDPIYAPFIDPLSRIEAYCTIDSGRERETYIGRRAWLMKMVHVGHDAWILDDVEIAPMTSVGGHVTLEHGVKVGQGATFKPYITVGEGARIGMGAVVISDVPAGEVWAGNPARRIESHSKAPHNEWVSWYEDSRA
jgi:acyl-[acyl carrier protein]--UDP-N-acetylglucosamine O-acyltransferase